MVTRTQEIFEKLCDLQVENLIKKLEDGIATAAEHAVIRNILKDAGIQLIPTGKAAKSLMEMLPFNDEDTDDKIIRMPRTN